LYTAAQNFSSEQVHTTESGQVCKSGKQLQPTAAAICIPGLGLDFLLVMVGLSDQTWLCFLDALALVGYWFASRIILCQG
jgi:hypothetical protein